jgi:hypothetical protein
MKFRYFELFSSYSYYKYKEENKSVKYPSFQKVEWPFIIDHGQSISEILLFSHKESKISVKKIAKLTNIKNVDSNGVIRIKGLGELSEKMVDEIEGMCHWLGHLNVFFYTEDLAFINKLCKLYPFPGRFVEDDLMMEDEDDKIRLKSMLNKYLKRGYIFSFFGDDSFLALWGDDSILANIYKEG